MANWKQVSRECFEAARVLMNAGHYRSSVNRSYYAVYATITGMLIDKGCATFIDGRPNPSHSQAMQMLEHNLLNHRRRDIRRRLMKSVKNTRRSRGISDYIFGISIDRATALTTLRDASLVVHPGGRDIMNDQQKDIEAVAKLIQNLLNHAAGGAGKQVRVHPKGIRFEQPSDTASFWWVPVLIDPNEQEMYRVYEALSEVEDQFDYQGVTGLFLSPGFLEYTPSKKAG